MRPQSNLDDDFDAGFDAVDDFATTSPPSWADNALADLEQEALSRQSDVLAAPTAQDAAFEDAAGKDAEEPQGAGDAPLGGGVPRISIHVFCEKPQTAQVAEAASRDRRMARATTTVKPGGLAAAVQFYQNQPTPPLIVVESTSPGDTLLGQLDSLAEVCDPGTKVMVIGAANDIALYRELMRRGVSEYLVPPLQPMQMIAAVTTLYADPAAAFTGRQIAFVGAKGGVGASTLAHNFAYALAERAQAHTVMVDMDLAFGTAGLDFNQDPLQGVATALGQPDRLDPTLLERMMARCSDRLSLFAAPATLDDVYSYDVSAYEEVTTKIRSTAPFVVLDLPHLWSDWVRRTIMASDDVIIVATPDLASLRNAKNMVDLLKHARPNDAPPRLVLNQVGVPGRPEIPTKEFAAAIGLQPTLVLPFDAKLFGKAANDGKMIHEIGAQSKAAEGFDQLAQLISNREPVAAPAVKKSSLSSLFKRK